MPIDHGLRTRCTAALLSCLADPGEGSRHAAYELGRGALDANVPLLDFVDILYRSVVDVACRQSDASYVERSTASIGDFITECLSPYEMRLRTAAEANDALRQQAEFLEEEARRIAHAVHDNSAQLLAAVHVELHLLGIEADAPLRPRVEQVRKLLNGVEEDLRRLAHELRPTILDDLGLLPALRSLADTFAKRTGIRVSVNCGREAEFPPRVELAIYRVVQEALTNVSRHAGASSIVVAIEAEDRELRCTVSDDGIGFTASLARNASGRRGLGLVGIRERLATIGGSLRCESREDGVGARLIAVIPIEETYVASYPDR